MCPGSWGPKRGTVSDQEQLGRRFVLALEQPEVLISSWPRSMIHGTQASEEGR